MSANCPGFRPHTARATRCRRCFRDYNDHTPQQLAAKDTQGNKGSRDATRSSAHDQNNAVDSDLTTNITVSLPRRSVRDADSASEDSASESKNEGKVNSTDSARKNNEEIGKESNKSAIRRRKPSSETADSTKSESQNESKTDTTSNSLPRTRKVTEEVKTPTTSSMERKRKPVSEAAASTAEPSNSSTLERRRRIDPIKSTSSEEDTKSKRIQIITAEEVKRNELILSDRNEVTSPDVEFILRVKTTAAIMRESDDTDSIAATETTETTMTLESFEDLQSTVNTLNREVEELTEKCKRLEKEKNDIINKRKISEKDKEALEKTASEILKLRATINELKCANEDLKDEKKVVQLEVKELKKELEKRKPPEKAKAESEELSKKLQQAETLCEELMEENEDMKREMKEMEEELEELHDNFREDQATEYLDLKKEVENTTKNCRVLQFKLRKAERKCEQLEMERNQSDERLKDLQATGKIDVDKAKMKGLETELSVAKEISLKMHSELENMKEAVKKLETDKDALKKQATSGEKNNHGPSISEMPSLSKEAMAGKDYETLLRDLYDTMERETDLREQMRFAEDEIKTMRRKVSSLEQENETVVMQLKKMAASKSSKQKNDSDELTPEELKLQFELCEQEMCVLRKKVDELEHENENFQQEIKYLQDKLINQPLAHMQMPDIISADKSSPHLYLDQKNKLLEYEARELRRKLIEKERENERLQTEVEVHRRKASKVIVRSRSLDSELQVDLKRQLQLVEQEASILRQKTMDLENENEKVINENKRFQLRLSRKPPPGPADLMQIENIELKEKVQELERKCTTLKEELQKCSDGSVPSTVIQDYKPRKESLSSDTESQLITSLKKSLKTKDDETITLNARVTQLEIENGRLNREYKKLKDTLNYKKRPCRIVRETATRLELKEIIKELEDEITDLQITIRGKETVHEDVAEELKKTKKVFETVQKEMKQQIGKLTAEANNSQQQVALLKSDATSQRDKAKSLQQQVEQLAREQGTDLQVMEQLQALEKEKETIQTKLSSVDDSLEKERAKGRELQDKFTTISAMKDDLVKGSKLLETHKNEMEKEVKQQKELLKKSEDQVKTFQKKLEETQTDLISARKECNELKNEIKDERSRLKQNDNRQTEVAVGWLKEREELKRLLSELRDKAETLQKQMDSQDRQSKETELRLREEFQKKQVKTGKDARTQLDAELKLLEKEGKSAKNKVTELTDEIEKLETRIKEYQEKNKNISSQLRKEREERQAAEVSLEDEKRAEIRKRERLEKDYDQERRQKEQELLATRDRIVQLEREQRKMQIKMEETETEKNDKKKQMEKEIAQERQEYDDLTTKYEMLEEELVAVKAKLVLEKEQLQGNFITIKQNYDQTCSELQAVRDTFSKKQDSWIKEKLDLTERNKELKAKVDRLLSYEQEKSRWKDTIEEKESLIESYKKEERHLKEERERLRRRVDELGKRVVELERAERASRTMSIVGKSDTMKDSVDLRIKLEHSEQSHKAEMATLKAEYEGRIILMSQEMQTMQMQIASLANEKEDFKIRADEVEATMEEIKTNSLKRERIKNREEVEKARRHGDELQKQLIETSEKLEEANLQNKNIKLHLETDRATSQIQMSDLKSKINQLEERNLMETSRSSSRPYVKTRLELAWEKERQEQQRLLSEHQNLVSELRDKVITLETLRDKEKQDSRRQLHDMRSLADIEERGTYRRISELQGDMSELRETNNRLRVQNDRLRKERERFEREREEWRSRLFSTQDMQVKVSDLLDEVQKMATLVSPVPENINGLATNANKEADTTEKKPKPPRRLSKTQDELRQAVEKIKLRTQELCKASANLSDERFRRNPSFRRAISASDVNVPLQGSESADPGQRWMNPQRITNYPLAPPSMYIRAPPRQKGSFRKSLSLDQQLGSYDKIWDSGDESAGTTPSGSQLSLRGYSRGYGYESDSSVGEISISSRASTLPRGGSAGASVLNRPLQSSREGSAESVDDVPIVRKPKKTLKEKLKAFKKKHSIENSPTAESVAQASIASVTVGLGLPGTPVSKPEKEDKSIRSRISKALKKPLSRSSSLDRAASDHEVKIDHSSKQSTLQTGDATGNKGKKPLLGNWGRTRSIDAEPKQVPSEKPTSSSQVRPIRQRSTETHL